MKRYSEWSKLPQADASNRLTDGCIALEGGAFRGVYGEGVLDVLMQEDLNFQYTIGVSAGAMNGANYVSGQIGRAARINLGFRHDKRYVGLRAYPKNGGIIGFDYLFNRLPAPPLDMARMLDPARRFEVVATDCRTGKAVYFASGDCDMLRAIQASASMPYVSRTVDVDGAPYLDGGCDGGAKIPFRRPLEAGARRVVVVRTREPGYRKKTSESAARAARLVYGRKYPEFAKTLARSDRDYNDACDELEALQKQGKVFVIAPSEKVDVSRLERDMEKLGALYRLGVSDARRALPALREFLK